MGDNIVDGPAFVYILNDGVAYSTPGRSRPARQPAAVEEPVHWTYQGKGLLETCQRLHSSLCGTAGPLGELEEQQMVDWLTRRLAAWRKPQGSRWGGFEDAVRKVVEAVLRERETESGWLRARSEGVPR